MAKKSAKQASITVNNETQAVEVRTKPELAQMALAIKEKLMGEIKEHIRKSLEVGFKVKGYKPQADEVLVVVGKDLGYLAATKGQGAWAGTYPTREGAELVDMEDEYTEYTQLKDEHATAPLAPPKALTPEEKAKRDLKKVLTRVDVDQLKLMLSEIEQAQ